MIIYNKNKIIQHTYAIAHDFSWLSKNNKSFDDACKPQIKPKRNIRSIGILPKIKKMKRVKTATRIRIVDAEVSPIPLPTVQANSDYGKSIFKKMISKQNKMHGGNPLCKHKISGSIRARMIDWMVECFSVYGNSQESFFYSVYIFDNFLSKNELKLGDEHVHLLGTCSMFLSSKYSDICPLSLNELVNKIAYGEFQHNRVKKTEIQILDTLGWNINFVTPLSFIKMTMMLMENTVKSQSFKPLFENLKAHAIQYSKMAMINEEFLEFCPSEIAFAAFSNA